MELRHLSRIIFKKFGIGGVMIFIGLIGIVFAVRDYAVIDSAKNMPGHMSFDFKVDLAVTAIGLIGGALALFIRMKKLAKQEEERLAAQAEAERRAKSDPKYYDKLKNR